MSVAVTIPHEPAAAPRAAAGSSVEFRYTQTDSFPTLLRQLGASLAVTTYQANKLLIARAAANAGLSMLVRTFDRPMGMATAAGKIALGTRDQVWQFRNAADIAPRVEPAGTHDACFLPRCSHVTGDIALHEMAWGGRTGEDLWIVNTRFSCLCTLALDYSFVPRWRPPFVTQLAPEDRCHLNGLAIVQGRPAYVTALGQTNEAGGWRQSKAYGGCILDVRTGDPIVRGLSMPHSPRWFDGKLWVLESGTGRLLRVDLPRGQCAVVADLPGFARGLAFCGRYAFIGLSRIRPTSAMDGVPLADRREQLICGVAAVDLAAGRVCGILKFQSAVEEVFEVQLIAGHLFPELMGFQKDAVRHTFVVPPEAALSRPCGPADTLA